MRSVRINAIENGYTVNTSIDLETSERFFGTVDDALKYAGVLLVPESPERDASESPQTD